MAICVTICRFRLADPLFRKFAARRKRKKAERIKKTTERGKNKERRKQKAENEYDVKSNAVRYTG